MPWFGPTCGDVLLLSPGGDRLELSPGSGTFLKISQPCICRDPVFCGICTDPRPSTSTVDLGAAPIFGTVGNSCDSVCTSIGGEYITPRTLACNYGQTFDLCTVSGKDYKLHIGIVHKFAFAVWSWEATCTIYSIAPTTVATFAVYSDQTTTDCVAKTYTLTRSSQSANNNIACDFGHNPTPPSAPKWPATIDLIFP